MNNLRIELVRRPEHLEEIRRLFREYEGSLGIDLCFQGFEEEVASLPGKYAAPYGELLLALDQDGASLGCVALRPLDISGCCEMKRLYVRDAGRGRGVGSTLIEAIIRSGGNLGYERMLLDTLPSLESAIRLYKKFGFKPTEPYNESPEPDTLYMAIDLPGRDYFEQYE